MCGRFISPDEAAIERAWHAGRRNNVPFVRRYNVAPTATIPVLHMDRRTGQLQLLAARWGLIPHWWARAKPPGAAFNARIEEAASKPMWRDAYRSARCLIPAEGWYEWKDSAAKASGRVFKQPYLVRRRDREPFCFAGLLSRRPDPATGESALSCAVLTTAASGALATLHGRMPVVMPDAFHGAWLEADFTTGEKVPALAQAAAAAEQMEHYPVNLRVNDARIDAPELLVPLAGSET